jgi:hypothetical protein
MPREELFVIGFEAIALFVGLVLLFMAAVLALAWWPPRNWERREWLKGAKTPF